MASVLRKQLIKGQSKQYIRTVIRIKDGWGDVRIGNKTYKVKQHSDCWRIVKRIVT